MCPHESSRRSRSGHSRIARIVAHQMTVKRREDVGHVERPGRVARAGREQRANDALAHVVGLELELGQLEVVRLCMGAVIPGPAHATLGNGGQGGLDPARMDDG